MVQLTRRMRGRTAACVVLAGLLGAAIGPRAVESAANPNASRIAFEGDRFGGWGIGVMKPDGSGITDLQTPFGAADASWSPNGKYIAFEGDPNGDGNLEIFVMNADGTNVRQLTDSPAPDYWPDWFPNGRQIAFTSVRDGAPNIYVMDADGGDQHAITETGTAFGSYQPDVSPNGQQVLFMRSLQFDPPAIWVINTDGSGLTQLTPNGPHADNEAQWSPNGRHIVFSSNRTGTFEIFVMEASGAAPTQLTASAGADFNPTFSPDGRQIAWWKLRFGQGDIWTMNLDGTNQVNVTDSPTFEGFPDWHQGHLGSK